MWLPLLGVLRPEATVLCGVVGDFFPLLGALSVAEAVAVVLWAEDVERVEECEEVCWTVLPGVPSRDLDVAAPVLAGVLSRDLEADPASLVVTTVSLRPLWTVRVTSFLLGSRAASLRSSVFLAAVVV